MREVEKEQVEDTQTSAVVTMRCYSFDLLDRLRHRSFSRTHIVEVGLASAGSNLGAASVSRGLDQAFVSIYVNVKDSKIRVIWMQ